MNREDIVKVLNRYAKSVNPEFKVDGDGDLVLWVRYDAVAWFKDYQKDKFVLDATVDNDLAETVIETEILNRFYTKAVELLKKTEKKYTVQVFNNSGGYLYWDPMNCVYQVGYLNDEFFKGEFTQDEIDVLKKRKNIAIDWNKAIIEEVDD